MDENAATAALKLHLNELRKSYDFQGMMGTQPPCSSNGSCSDTSMKLIIVNLVNKHKDQG